MARRSNAKQTIANDAAREDPPTVTLPALLECGSDREFRELIAELYSFIGHLQAMRRELADALNVSIAEFGVLMGVRHLARFGRVRVKSVADHLHISASNVTATIASLNASGWLRKSVDPDDQRAVCIELTSSGRETLDVFARDSCELNDIWFRGVSRAEMLAVTTFLRRLDVSYLPALFAAKSINRRNVTPQSIRA